MRLMEKVRSGDICSGGGRGGTKRGSCWVGDGKFEGVDGGREEGDDVAKML